MQKRGVVARVKRAFSINMVNYFTVVCSSTCYNTFSEIKQTTRYISLVRRSVCRKDETTSKSNVLGPEKQEYGITDSYRSILSPNKTHKASRDYGVGVR